MRARFRALRARLVSLRSELQSLNRKAFCLAPGPLNLAPEAAGAGSGAFRLAPGVTGAARGALPGNRGDTELPGAKVSGLCARLTGTGPGVSALRSGIRARRPRRRDREATWKPSPPAGAARQRPPRYPASKLQTSGASGPRNLGTSEPRNLGTQKRRSGTEARKPEALAARKRRIAAARARKTPRLGRGVRCDQQAAVGLS